MKKEQLMLSAIQDAKKKNHHFGALIATKNGTIISKAGKRPPHDPRYHAESQAIIKATNKLKTKSLKGHTLYSTCEPCPMCFYLAFITGIDKIIFGASNKDAMKAGIKEIGITDKQLNAHCKDHKIKIEPGFMRKECLELFGK